MFHCPFTLSRELCMDYLTRQQNRHPIELYLDVIRCYIFQSKLNARNSWYERFVSFF